ncbi:MAG: DNA repair protein RecO [Sedimentisphaerales bacterium]|nr:DNA repair protein RecO [Sedimentisphaerales bacterium]
MLNKDLAICIRTVDYSETSQIVTFFTREHGKIGAIAKGSKRQKSSFDGPIEVFAYGQILFTNTDRDKLATLTEFETSSHSINGTSLYKNLFVLNCCFFATELLNKLIDDYHPHEQLFDSFIQFIQNAHEQNEDRILSLLIMFQLTLLSEVGLQPILNYCTNCKMSCEPQDTNDEYYFSSSANGLICKDCEISFHDKIRLSQSAANCLVNLKIITQANKKTLQEIEKIMIIHFTNILGHPPKMAKHILKK